MSSAVVMASLDVGGTFVWVLVSRSQAGELGVSQKTEQDTHGTAVTLQIAVPLLLLAQTCRAQRAGTADVVGEQDWCHRGILAWSLASR